MIFNLRLHYMVALHGFGASLRRQVKVSMRLEVDLWQVDSVYVEEPVRLT